MPNKPQESVTQMNKRLDTIKASSQKKGTLYNAADWEPKGYEGSAEKMTRIAGRKQAQAADPYHQALHQTISDIVDRQAATARNESPSVTMMGAHADDLREAAVHNYNMGNVSVDHAQDVIKHATSAGAAVADARVRHANGDYAGASARLKEAADGLRDGAVKLLSGRSVQNAAADAIFGS